MSQTITTPDLPVVISPYSIEEIGRRQGGTIHTYVHGFWSDVITVYVRRDWRWKQNDGDVAHSWVIEVTHSSGGRDTKQVEDDIQAHEYFAQAVTAVCLEARKIRSQIAELERLARITDEEHRLKEQAEMAAEQAAIAADPAMGEKQASALLNEAALMTTRRTSITINARPRGTSRQVTKFEVKQGRDGVNRFFVQGVMVKRADVVSALASCAADSYIQQA